MVERRMAVVAPPAAAPATQRAGFALLSIMIAIVLIATGVMAIAAANTTRQRQQTVSGARTGALNLARDYSEIVRGRDPWTLTSESPVSVDATGALASTGEFTRELLVSIDKPNLLRVEIVVTATSLTNPVRLVTNIYRGAKIAAGI
jgi:hypothetical protein